MMEFGNKIRFLRQQKGLTQVDLANSLYISYQLVSKWERNVSIPTVDILLNMISIYHLPLDFFNSSYTSIEQQSEKELIFVGFIGTMTQSYTECPTIKSISIVSEIPEIKIRKYFQNINELIYAFIVDTDKKIKIEVESKILSKKNILDIFIDDMAPLLYKKRLEINLLYTRPYIRNTWIMFIQNKYKNIISKHPSTISTDKFDLEYAIAILTSLISIWLSQSNPESLESFQLRIKKITEKPLSQWSLFTDNT